MNVITLIPTVAAMLGAFVALVTYQRSQRARRVEWLWRLHQSFFVSTTHRRIRHLLDGAAPARVERLERALAGRGDDDLAEAFVDFLNYFEFIGALSHLRELRWSEVDLLVGYYLGVLDRHPFVRRFITAYGFKHTADLLAARRIRDTTGRSS
jgi:hypothetical protein